MESNQKTQDNNDDLDLLSLIEKALFFLRQFWKPIFICTFLGLLLGLTYYFLSPKQYESRLLLQSRVLTNKEQIEIIETWKELIRKREYAALARITSTDVALLKKIKKISADEIQKLYVQNNPNGFYVDVMVTDTAVLRQVESAIINGLEHSAYVRERVASKKAFFNEMIANIQVEISKLESTKRVIDSMIRNKPSGSTSLLLDVSNLNGQWVGLNEKLLSFREELRFTRAVQVLQHFTPSEKQESPKLLKSIVISTAAGLFIGYMIAILLSIRQKLRLRTRVMRARNYETAE